MLSIQRQAINLIFRHRQIRAAVGTIRRLRPRPFDFMSTDRPAAIGTGCRQKLKPVFKARRSRCRRRRCGRRWFRLFHCTRRILPDQRFSHAADGNQYQNARPPPILPEQDRQPNQPYRSLNGMPGASQFWLVFMIECSLITNSLKLAHR